MVVDGFEVMEGWMNINRSAVRAESRSHEAMATRH
jgi:hypothetical protein